jgi:hypothetical protein
MIVLYNHCGIRYERSTMHTGGFSMIFIVKRLFVLALAVSLLSGCPAAVVGTAMVGTGAGTYLSVNGELKTDYYYSFDKVWSATEKTIATMHGMDVTPSRGIGSGNIVAMINGEKVTFNIHYKEKGITNVGIRVGLIGDEPASKLIHGKILDHLKQ